MGIVFSWCSEGIIIGIPFGVQCFKIAGFAFRLFRREVELGGFGVMVILGNVIWILVCGILMEKLRSCGSRAVTVRHKPMLRNRINRLLDLIVLRFTGKTAVILIPQLAE